MAVASSSTTTDRLAEIDPLWTVHNSAYTEQAFQMELEGIFRRAWVFFCHESELATAGCFITRDVAGDPILAVRASSGQIRAFHNVCRHRGSMVVNEQAGTCQQFRCPYHHWTYSLDGELTGVPGRAAYDHRGFREQDFGLAPVRCEAVYGLVFVCLDDTAPALGEYLGSELLAVLEQPLGRAQLEVFYAEDWLLEANWKMFAENARDGYHVPFVHHESVLRVGSPVRPYRLFEGAYAPAVQWVDWDPQAIAEADWQETSKFPLPGFQPGEGWVANIFPDFTIMARGNVVEYFVQTPLSHDKTLFGVRVLGVVGDDLEQRASRQRSLDVWLRTQWPEDKAVMQAQQRGLKSKGMRTSLIARGSEAVEGTRGDDNRLRQFWKAWRQQMGVPENRVPGA